MMNALQRLDKQFEATYLACFPSVKSEVDTRALVEGNASFAALLTFAILRALLARAFWLNRRNIPIAREVQPLAIDTRPTAAYPVFGDDSPYVCAARAGSPIYNKFTGERVGPLPQPIPVQAVAQPLKTTRRGILHWRKDKKRAKPTPATPMAAKTPAYIPWVYPSG